MIDFHTETLLTVTEAAEMLHRCKETVRSWIVQGKLEGLRLGGRWLTSVEAIERFAAPPEPMPEIRSPAKRRKEEEEALEYLRKVGVAR